MTSIRRLALRLALGVVASLSVGLIGASAASAQPALAGDIAWKTTGVVVHVNDIAW